MKIRITTIVLAIVALLLVLIPRISHSQTSVSLGVALPSPVPSIPITNSSEPDSPCFYRQADGAIVDLQSICGTGSTTMPVSGGMVQPKSSGMVNARSAPTNPAMEITPPDDPGVLYLSGSGASDPAATAASQAEQKAAR